MESQNIQQLTNDIQNEASNSLNKSQSEVAVQNDSGLGDNSQELQSSIDINKTELNDVVGEKEVEHFAEGIPPMKKKLQQTCWVDEDGNRVCI
ncbi:hypothetical protein [Nostoc sp. CALU 1950]|uniref:hypothetical protein n=1 Tax=Nostoc sp. CALU 1950 TaxID=3104321 RepID=UPI003EC0B425